MAKMISIFYSAKNFKLKLVFVRWMNMHMGKSYVAHVNLNSGLDENTAEYIDPSDAENDKNDSLFSGIKAPKMPKMGMPSMPKLGMPSMSMPKLSMPDMPSMPSMPGMPGMVSESSHCPAHLAPRRVSSCACLLTTVFLFFCSLPAARNAWIRL